MEGSSRLYDYGDILQDDNGILYIYINDLDSHNEDGIIDVAIINGEDYGKLTKIKEDDYKLLSNFTYYADGDVDNSDKIFLTEIYHHIYSDELYVIKVNKDTNDDEYFYTVSLTYHPGRLIRSKKSYFTSIGMCYLKVNILDYIEKEA